MIRVAIGKLEPGMVLAAPVRHPAAESHVLLNGNYLLDVGVIARLRDFGVNAVWVRHPGFDFLDARLGDEIPRCRAKLYQSVKRSFAGIANQTIGVFDLLEFRRVITNMMLAMMADKKNAVWAERLLDGDGELFAHCSNVAYLSMVIAMRIKNYVCSERERERVRREHAIDLTNLGIGAMLHDLGKLGLDPLWHDVHLFDARAESDVYRSHSERGFRAVQQRIEPTAAAVLLHHHQRYDGAGFPKPKQQHEERSVKPMKGPNIHIFARIAAVANAIDALMSTYRERKLPFVAALSAIQGGAYYGMFDPVVLRAALRVVPPFPLGACVGLSDGQEAAVTDFNERAPCQPKVRPLGPDPQSGGEAGEEIDLAAPDAPCIVTYDDQPIREFLYTLT